MYCREPTDLHFARLAALSGERGAKQIIRDNGMAVTSIPFAKGALDIDTPDDIERSSEDQVSPD